MTSFGRLRGMSSEDDITSEEMRSMIMKTIGSYKDLLNIVKRVNWHGHVIISTELDKTVTRIRYGEREETDKEKMER